MQTLLHRSWERKCPILQGHGRFSVSQFQLVFQIVSKVKVSDNFAVYAYPECLSSCWACHRLGTMPQSRFSDTFLFLCLFFFLLTTRYNSWQGGEKAFFLRLSPRARIAVSCSRWIFIAAEQVGTHSHLNLSATLRTVVWIAQKKLATP